MRSVKREIVEPESGMLNSQRHQFDVPRNVCYFNAAGWSPLPIRTVEAARMAVARKSQPWKLSASFATEQNERARIAASRLINADAEDMALVSSIAYGVASAAKSLIIPRGTRVIVLENDHTSPVLEWMTRSEEQGFIVDTVPQPANGDWTSAVLDAISRPGAPPVSVASIASVHWSDGGLIDLEAVAGGLRRQGALFLIDATHGAGVLALDVKTLDPDFVFFPTYKWLLGPYGRAFMYVAKRHQNGVPLEQTSYGRRSVKAEQDVYFLDTRYLPDARRFDMGERDHFISMEMASIGMEMMAEWGANSVAGRLRQLTTSIADALEDAPVSVHRAEFRAPHILSLGFKNRMAVDLVDALAAEAIYVAPRLGRMRISPHVYNDDSDVEKFVSALRRQLK